MASNFSSLGFDVPDRQAIARLVLDAAIQGESHPVDVGRYVCWAPGAGIELWVQIGVEGGIVGFDPHLGGTPGYRVRIDAWLERPGASPLDGAASAWALDRSGGPGFSDEGFYPFVFDMPDVRRYRGLTLPAIVDLQVGAIARDLTVHADDAALRETGSRFAPESFIPSGMFRLGGDTADPPSAQAILNGHVLTAEERINPRSGLPFRYLRVKTLGGELDVAADPTVLTTTPAPGAVVSGTFWLSGRIAGPPVPPEALSTSGAPDATSPVAAPTAPDPDPDPDPATPPGTPGPSPVAPEPEAQARRPGFLDRFRRPR